MSSIFTICLYHYKCLFYNISLFCYLKSLLVHYTWCLLFMGDYFWLLSDSTPSSFESQVTWIEGVSVKISFAFAFAKCQSLFLPQGYLMCYLFNVEFSEPLSNIYSHHKLIENITVILKFQRAQVEKDRLPLHLTLSEFCFFPPK